MRFTDDSIAFSNRMGRRAFCAGAAAGAAALFTGCPAPPPKKKPNIVFLVLDTVRADHTSAWGHPLQTTPTLLALLKHATKYERAYAPAPWTLPSHAAMFTGQYPSSNGVHTHLVDAPGDPQIVEPPLAVKYFTIAEALSQEGYDTAAFVANTGYLHPKYRLTQGFGTYECIRTAGEPLARKASRWMLRRHGRPFFLFMNFIDAHYPYNTEPVPGLFNFPVSQDPALLKRWSDIVLPGNGDDDPDLKRQVTAQYLNGMVHADAAAGMVLETLKDLGVYDETLIIYTSDHGEFLGEHRLLQHSKDLYNPVSWVPLGIRRPGQVVAESIARPVSLIDISGEILREVAGDASEKAFPSFYEQHSSHHPVLSEVYYSREWDLRRPAWRPRFMRVRAAIYDGPWKYIRSSDGNHELFNVLDDPGELNNQLGTETERAATMRAALDKASPMDLARVAPSAVESLMDDQAHRDELESLGYL